MVHKNWLQHSLFSTGIALSMLVMSFSQAATEQGAAQTPNYAEQVKAMEKQLYTGKMLSKSAKKILQ